MNPGRHSRATRKMRPPARWKRATQQAGSLRYGRNAGFSRLVGISPTSSRLVSRPRREHPRFMGGILRNEISRTGPLNQGGLESPPNPQTRKSALRGCLVGIACLVAFLLAPPVAAAERPDSSIVVDER